MSCKCGADRYTSHQKRVQEGYPAHVYKGHYWAPTDDEPDGGADQYAKSMEAK